MKVTTTPTRPDSLNPGDHIVWTPAPGGVAEIEHVVVRNDRPAARTLEFTFGGSVLCDATDEFLKIEKGE